MKKNIIINQFLCAISFFLFFASNSFPTDYYNFQNVPIATLPDPPSLGYINEIALSPDGTQLLTGDSVSAIKLWNLKSGDVLKTYEIEPVTLDPSPDTTVTSLEFSPDGKKFIAAYKGYPKVDCEGNVARIWDLNSGKILATFYGHKAYVNAAAFSPDGTKVATCSGTSDKDSLDKTAKIWNTETGEEIFTLKGHTAGINSLAFSKDGTKLVTGGYDNCAILWDVNTGQQILSVSDAQCDIKKVQFSPDNQKFVTLGIGKSPLIIWDASTGQALKKLTESKASSGFHSIIFQATGQVLAISQEYPYFYIWDVETKKVICTTLNRYTGSYRYPAIFSNDGSQIFTAISNSLVIRSAVTGQTLKTLGGHSEKFSCLSYSPDGSLAISGSDDQTAIIWDINNHKEIHRLTGHTDSIHAAIFSPDGKKAATGSSDKTIKIWDVDSGTELRTLQGSQNAIASINYSKDGSKLLTGCENGKVILWDSNSGNKIASFTPHTRSIKYVAFSSDETAILTGSDDATVKLWDANTGNAIFRLVNSYIGSFSPDKTEIFTIADPYSRDNCTINVWNSKNGEFLRKLPFNPGGYSLLGTNVLTFSPNGKLLYYSNYNLLLDSQTGAYVGSPFLPNADWIFAAAFSPDNSSILCGGYYGFLGNIYSLRIFDTQYLKSPAPYNVDTEEIYSAIVLPDGIKVLTGTLQGKTVQFTLRNITTDKIECKFSTPKNNLCYAKISPDGKNLVVFYIGQQGTFVFETKTGQQLYQISSSTPYYPLNETFSGDSHKIITLNTGCNTASIWDCNTGTLLSELLGEQSNIFTAALSEDGSTAVTGGLDQTIRLWNADTGIKKNEFSENRDAIYRLSISPDGHKIISYDNHFHTLWDFSTNSDTPKFRHIIKHKLNFNNDVYFCRNTNFIFFEIHSTNPIPAVVLYDFENEKEIRSFQGEFLTLSKDNKTLVTKNGQDVIVWDLSEYMKNSDPTTSIQDWSLF